ncbi:MAG: c(7)-type cytochrome triheme domain-containing protein [Gammaproteobacteria bacterium]
MIGAAQAENWQTLREDGLHDPNVATLPLLQEPREALQVLPPDGAGNKVNWVQALQGGYIAPRTSLWQDKASKILDSDVVMKGAGSLPYVRFPHKPHSEWLDCVNCHDGIFKAKAGATPVTMAAILEGEYCGRCHGAVSFPLTECNRCHTVPVDSVPPATR